MSDEAGADPSSGDQRSVERRRLIDLTRRDKGLPERRNLGVDRRRNDRLADNDAPAGGDADGPANDPPAEA